MVLGDLRGGMDLAHMQVVRITRYKMA